MTAYSKYTTHSNKPYLILMGVLFLLLWMGFFIAAKKLRADELRDFDGKIIGFIQGHISESLTAFMTGITFFGGKTWIIAAVLLLTIFFFFIKRRYAVYLLLTSATGSVLNLLLKQLFQRERPDIYPLITVEGYSFPSGHSMGSFIFYISLAVVLSKWSKSRLLDSLIVLLFAALIILIGISRIYLGVHYPSDVIAGYCAGGGWVIICTLALHYYETRKAVTGNSA